MIWHKLNYLVPDPKCTTNGDEIIEWTDSRPQPTQAEIDSVTDAQIKTALVEPNLRAKFTEREDTTLLLFFELTNMVRVLEGKSKITKQQFWNAVKDRHKNQQFFDF